MVHLAKKVRFKALGSELEALLIEAELIRTHQPPFNVALKDDKSAIYVQITDEKFPRVLTARKREVITKNLKGQILGPFSSAYRLNEVLTLVRPIFKWCNQRGDNLAGKPCFYLHLDQCNGACVGEISAQDYQANITQLVLFLRGKLKDVNKNLIAQLKQEADQENFERAAQLRDMVKLIQSVTDPKRRLKPELTLPKITSSLEQEGLATIARWLSEYMLLPKKLPLSRIECYDVSNTQGTNPTVAMVVAEHGKPSPKDYRLFNIRELNTPNDYAMMKEAIVRRQNHPEWGRADLMVMDGGKGQLRAAFSVWQLAAPVISIAKDPDRIILPVIKDQKIVSWHELKLPANNPGLQLIQRLRDEAHRFSQKQHKRMRQKAMLSLK